MEKTAMINELFDNIEQCNFEKVNQMLADDFVFEGPFPEPQNKEEFIKSHQNLVNATSQFSYNQRNLQEVGNTVKGEIRITGKNTGKLDLGFMHGPVLEPTGKNIELTQDEFEATIENGKIQRLKSIPHEGGGVEGYLHAIGAEIPEQAH